MPPRKSTILLLWLESSYREAYLQRSSSALALQRVAAGSRLCWLLSLCSLCRALSAAFAGSFCRALLALSAAFAGMGMDMYEKEWPMDGPNGWSVERVVCNPRLRRVKEVWYQDKNAATKEANEEQAGMDMYEKEWPMDGPNGWRLERVVCNLRLRMVKEVWYQDKKAAKKEAEEAKEAEEQKEAEKKAAKEAEDQKKAEEQLKEAKKKIAKEKAKKARKIRDAKTRQKKSKKGQKKSKKRKLLQKGSAKKAAKKATNTGESSMKT